MNSADSIQPTPEYQRDIEIFNSEPWKEKGPVDELIGLQQEAFGADLDGDKKKFGSIVFSMAKIESSIGNHSAAAHYASEAAEAFTETGQNEDAVAAHSVVAKENRTLDSPDLVLASLEDIIMLRTAQSGVDSGLSSPAIDEQITPILKLLQSFTSTYRNSTNRWTYNETDNDAYPSLILPRRSRLPSLGSLEAFGSALVGTNTLSCLLDAHRTNVFMMRKDIIHSDIQAIRDHQVLMSRPFLGRVAGRVLGV